MAVDVMATERYTKGTLVIDEGPAIDVASVSVEFEESLQSRFERVWQSDVSFEFESVMCSSDIRALFDRYHRDGPPFTMALFYSWGRFAPDVFPIVEVGGSRSCSVDAHGFELFTAGYIQLGETIFHEDGTVSVDMDFTEMGPEPTVGS